MTTIWLREDDRVVQEAMALLSDALPAGKKIVHIKCDSVHARDGKSAQCAYSRVDGEVTLQPKGVWDLTSHLYIPIGLGVTIPIAPFRHNERCVRQSRIERFGDFLQVSIPYYFLTDHSLVDWSDHTFFLKLTSDTV